MKQDTLMQINKKLQTFSALILGCATALVMSACSSTKNSAPIEVRPAAGSGIPRQDPLRRAEVPTAGVTPPVVAGAGGGPGSPSSGPSTTKPAPAGGAETSSVKPGSTESRPLSPANPGALATNGSAVATPPAAPSSPAPPPMVSQAPLKSGPKAIKRPYSETVLAEVKGADPIVYSSPSTNTPSTGVGTGSSSSAPTTSATAPATPAAATPPKTGVAPSFAWPTKGKVLANFSEPKQMGLILEGKLGEPIAAAGDGKVIFSGPGPRGYGNLIIVKHEGELLSVYAHNKTLLVKDQESVKKGHKIAELGDSGTDSPKLHFEIRRQGKPVDPKQYLPAR